MGRTGHAACLRAGRRCARSRWRSPRASAAAISRLARSCWSERIYRGVREWLWRFSARPYLYGPSHGRRGGARGPGRHPPGSPASQCRETGARLERGLKERFGQHPFVGDIRGRGLFWALELVGDRASKRPFDPTAKVHARVKREAMARGLMVYPMGGTIDGVTAIMSSWPLRSSSREAKSTRSSSASAQRSRRRSPMSGNPLRAARPPLKERTACEKAAPVQYPAAQVPIRRFSGPSKGFDFVARRFRRPVLILLPAILAASAFAQQAPMDLTAPTLAVQKSAKSSKAPRADPSGRSGGARQRLARRGSRHERRFCSDRAERKAFRGAIERGPSGPHEISNIPIRRGSRS